MGGQVHTGMRADDPSLTARGASQSVLGYAKSPILFALFTKDIFKDIVKDYELPVVILLSIAVFAVLRQFYLDAPSWASWLVTAYFLHILLGTISHMERTPKHVLKARKYAWYESLGVKPPLVPQVEEEVEPSKS